MTTDVAERATLGAALIDEDALHHVMSTLKTEDFQRAEHRAIFQAMHRLWLQRTSVDLLTLTEELRQRGDLEAVGGAQAIIQLQDVVPTAANVESYTKMVRERAASTALLQAAHKVLAFAKDESLTLEERQRGAEGALLEALDADESQRAVLWSFEGLRWLLRLRDQKDTPKPLDTGIDPLDRTVGGFLPGDLIILAARPALGKTTLAMQIAINMAREGRKVLFYSLEMPKEKLFARPVASKASVSTAALMAGRLTKDQWRRCWNVGESLDLDDFWVDDSPRITTIEVRAKSLRHQHEHGLDFVIVDYLQILDDSDQPGRTRNERVGGMARAMKALARELEVPVLLLSQLSRAPQDRRDKRPALSDLRDSGEIEMVGDVVMFLWSKDDEAKQDRVIDLFVAKNKMYRTGTVYGLAWDHNRAWFVTGRQKDEDETDHNSAL